ncbi:MAG: hypothetical protein OXL68_12265 [Paracoccaceae bacterium]|nr:hypothetical protein [Paracoccaceae bacterium]
MTIQPDCVRILRENRNFAAIRDGQLEHLTVDFRSVFGEGTGPVIMSATLDR